MAAARARPVKAPGAFRSIGEAAADLELEPHVLRYWEERFPRHVNPVKRADGRRFYRPQDLDALRAIRMLVHGHGLTLKGAKAILAGQGVAAVLAGNAKLTTEASDSPARQLQAQVAEAFAATPALPDRRTRLAGALDELAGLKSRLDALRQQRLA